MKRRVTCSSATSPVAPSSGRALRRKRRPAAAPPAGADRVAGSDGGEVILQSSGRRIHVEPDQTILQALTQAGVEVASSCEAGVCGTCSVRYVSGQPVHNDYVLSDEERQSSVLVCCAMVGAEPLALDL